MATQDTTYTLEFNGFTLTRTSHRTYTHACIVVDPFGRIGMSCCGSEELARKAAASWQSRFAAWSSEAEFHVLPLTPTTGAEAKAAKAREKSQKPAWDLLHREAEVKNRAWHESRQAAKLAAK